MIALQAVKCGEPLWDQQLDGLQLRWGLEAHGPHRLPCPDRRNVYANLSPFSAPFRQRRSRYILKCGHEFSVDDDPLAIEVSASDAQPPHCESGGIAAEVRGGTDGGTAGGLGEDVDSAHRVFEHEEPDTWPEIGAIPHDGSPNAKP